MATSTTHRPVGLAPSPWLRVVLFALAGLMLGWLAVAVIDAGGAGTSGSQTAAAQDHAQAGTHESTRRAGRTGIAPAGTELDIPAGVTRATPAANPMQQMR